VQLLYPLPMSVVVPHKPFNLSNYRRPTIARIIVTPRPNQVLTHHPKWSQDHLDLMTQSVRRGRTTGHFDPIGDYWSCEFGERVGFRRSYGEFLWSSRPRRCQQRCACNPDKTAIGKASNTDHVEPADPDACRFRGSRPCA
jgi:hypothetical protein